MAEQNGVKAWCSVKKRLISVGAVAGAIIAIATALGILDQYRWWVWASEFRVVANRVYEATIPEQRRVVSSIERDLERAKSIPPVRRDKHDNQLIIRLENDLAAEQDKLQRLYKERERFAPQ